VPDNYITEILAALPELVLIDSRGETGRTEKQIFSCISCVH
jgi:hypothetical protein